MGYDVWGAPMLTASPIKSPLLIVLLTLRAVSAVHFKRPSKVIIHRDTVTPHLPIAIFLTVCSTQLIFFTEFLAPHFLAQVQIYL